MNVPGHLTFYSADYALDGGSTTLCATDENGSEHRVYLPRGFDSTGNRTTGLLYFDDELIPARSTLESKLLNLFREAELAHRSVPRPGEMKLTSAFTVVGYDLERLVRGTVGDNLRFLVDSVITYVESDAYGSAGISGDLSRRLTVVVRGP